MNTYLLINFCSLMTIWYFQVHVSHLHEMFVQICYPLFYYVICLAMKSESSLCILHTILCKYLLRFLSLWWGGRRGSSLHTQVGIHMPHQKFILFCCFRVGLPTYLFLSFSLFFASLLALHPGSIYFSLKTFGCILVVIDQVWWVISDFDSLKMSWFELYS